MNRKLWLNAGVLLVCFYIILFCPKKAFAVTLFSTGFEQSSVSPWVSSGGGAIATISADFARGGTYSIRVSHDKTSSYGFQNTVQNIEPGMFYHFYGFGKSTDSYLASYFLRVAWYASTDGSGSQLSTPNDSNVISITGDWNLLDTSAIQAPSSANSAKIRLVLTSKTSGQLANVYFDDVVFEEAIAPTPTFTPTPTPTNVPSPSKTPTPNPTTVPSATSTVVPTNTSSPTASISATEGVPITLAVLGESTKEPSKGVEVLVGSEIHKKKSNNNAGIFLVIGGVIFLASCGILAYRVYKNKDIEKIE